jgi:alpha-galactosidase
VSYRFHVDEQTGDLLSDHFGGLVSEDPAIPGTTPATGWSTTSHLRREFPDLGKGDFRNPSIFLKHHEGHTVSNFRYQSYKITDGKPEVPELPATFGTAEEVKSLTIRLYDSHSQVAADLIYSIFPEHDAITRRVVLTNESEKSVTIEKLGSMSIDLPHSEYDIVGLRGEWSRERTHFRRKVDYGMQRYALVVACLTLLTLA